MSKVRVELRLTEDEKKYLQDLGSDNLHTGLRIIIAFHKMLRKKFKC